MAIGACAGTSAARLNAKQVVEQGDHEAIMQFAPGAEKAQRHNGKTPCLRATQNVDFLDCGKSREGSLYALALYRFNCIGADCLLKLEHQPGTDGFDNCRRAAFLTAFRGGNEAMALGGHVRHRAATDNAWHRI